jgi:hypothetical protein
MHPDGPGRPMADVPDRSVQAIEVRDWRKFRNGCLYFLLASSLMWTVLESIHVRFPYLQAGSDIVSNAKRSWSLTHPVFDDAAKVRILVFGNSKTLASFNPALFDTRVAEAGVSGKVQSFNEALPGERRFVVYLDQLLSAGARPTHVLIQFPPIPEDHELTLREWVRHDKMIVDTLFPFRTLPRDFTLFVFASFGHGGITGFYRESEQVAQQVLQDRGYYFLKGQTSARPPIHPPNLEPGPSTRHCRPSCGFPTSQNAIISRSYSSHPPTGPENSHRPRLETRSNRLCPATGSSSSLVTTIG